MKGIKRLRLALAGVAAGALLLAGGLLLVGNVDSGNQAAAPNTPTQQIQNESSDCPGQGGEYCDQQSSDNKSDDSFSWLIAGLSVVGVAALAGYSLFHVRTRY